MQHQRVLILDFGGQYNQLIARRVRELNVFCDLVPSDISLKEIERYAPIGIIFTGGPNSVYDENSPKIDRGVFELGIPVLGICYGCQLMAHTLGGVVEKGESPVEAAKRELLEETGYAGKRAKLVASYSPNPAIQNNMAHFVVIEDCRKVSETNWDQNEEIQTKLVDVSKLPAMIKSGKIYHSIAISSTYFLEQYLKKTKE